MQRTLLTVAAGLLTAGTHLTAEDTTADVAALAGGTPVPAGSHTLVIPNSPKQSISFRSDAEEVIVGTVAFGGEGTVGNLTLDADAGTGTASFSIPVAAMATGNDVRDEHLRSPDWLGADANPMITFSDVTLTKVADTVWHGTGTWTMNGASQEVSMHANVRFIPTFPRFGENVVRVNASFSLDLAAFGVDHPAVGSPAVAQEWSVTTTFLAKPAE